MHIIIIINNLCSSVCRMISDSYVTITQYHYDYVVFPQMTTKTYT